MGVYKNLASAEISDDAFVSLVGSVGTFVNGAGRIFWAGLLDYYPFRKVFGILIAIQLTCICLVGISVNYKWLYFIVIVLSLMCEGAMGSILPTMTMKYFRSRKGHEVYSYMYAAFGVQSVIGTVIVLLF